MLKRGSWLLAAVGLLASCGGNGGGAATKACADLAQARCAKRVTCSNSADIIRTYGDMNTCLVREQLACTIGLAAPMTGNSPANVEACVTAYATLSCADFQGNNPPAACINSGPIATGLPCAFGGQCASSYCNDNKAAACGTCGDPAAVGDSCQTSNCARGQSCVQRTATCEVLSGLNGPCDNNTLPCAADLSCIGNTGGNMGTCVQGSATVGTTCGGTTGAGCDGTMGLACQGAAGAKTCQPINYVGDGQPCGSLGGGVFTSCAAGGECQGPNGVVMAGEMGTCKTAVLEGAACDIVLGPPCLAPARCIIAGGSAGTCALPSGATCG